MWIWYTSSLCSSIPEKQTTIIKKDTCIPIFIAAPFTIARTWKQPRCPSVDEWIKIPWHIYTHRYIMEYYWAIKKKVFESILVRWINLESVIQSDGKSEREKQILYINTYIRNLEKWYSWTYLQGRRREADIQNGLWTQQGKERVGWPERVALTYIHHHV